MQAQGNHAASQLLPDHLFPQQTLPQTGVISSVPSEMTQHLVFLPQKPLPFLHGIGLRLQGIWESPKVSALA